MNEPAGKRLLLWRHGKSRVGEPQQDDADRALAPRGERQAALVAETCLRTPPDLVLCSPAVRARQTLAEAEAVWATPPPLRVEPGLYLADPLDLLDRIARIEEDVATTLVVGHNPGLEELVGLLAANGEAAALARFGEGFKTSCLAELHLPGRWREAGAGCATLASFVRPRELEAARAS